MDTLGTSGLAFVADVDYVDHGGYKWYVTYDSSGTDCKVLTEEEYKNSKKSEWCDVMNMFKEEL